MPVDSGQITLTINATDPSGIKDATAYWENPAGNLASITCGSFVDGTCAMTHATGSGEWAYHGAYEWSHIGLHDQNGLYRIYKADGRWEQGDGNGRHEFTVPDLTVTS